MKTNRTVSEVIRINQSVPQGCRSSPILLITYIDDMIEAWKQQTADDLMIVQNNETSLQ